MTLHLDTLRTLCFDLDHTLFDRELAMQHYLERWLTRHDLPSEPELIARAIEVDRTGYAPRRVFNQWWAGEMHARGQSLTMDEFWQDFKHHLSDELSPDQALNEMLRALGERYTLALVTNGGAENQRAKIAALGLDTCFEEDHIIVSDEVGFWKPEPEIFELALERTRSTHATTLFVGDDPVQDIAGAGHFGLATCWISRGRPWPARVPHDQRPDLVLEHVLRLAEAV